MIKRPLILKSKWIAEYFQINMIYNVYLKRDKVYLISPPLTCAATPHLCRLHSEEAEGKSVQVQSHNSPSLHTTARGHRTEGRTTDPWPLAEWDWQCSRHARREHRCKVPFSEYTWKVSTGVGAGEEEDVPGGLPPTRPALLSLCCLRQRAAGAQAMATQKRIASWLAKKWRQYYSRTCGYVKSRVPTTLVRSIHRSIWGSKLPAHKINVQRLQWEDGAGINLSR